MRNKDQGTYLSRVINEGFAHLVPTLLIDSPSLDAVDDSRERARETIEQVKAEAAASYWGWSRVNEKMRDYAHILGESFFGGAHVILQHSNPADYLEHLQTVLPTSEELLSVRGGEQWAARANQNRNVV